MSYRTDGFEPSPLLIVAVQGHVAAVNLQTGKEQWRNVLHGAGTGTVSIHVHEGLVLASPEDNVLVCLDYLTGQERWRATTRGHGRSTLMVVGERILVARLGYVTCLDWQGKVTWENALSGLGSGPTAMALPGLAAQADSHGGA